MKNTHCNDIDSILVGKYLNYWKPSKNSHCIHLVPAHRFFPPHAHCFSIFRFEGQCSFSQELFSHWCYEWDLLGTRSTSFSGTI